MVLWRYNSFSFSPSLLLSFSPSHLLHTVPGKHNGRCSKSYAYNTVRLHPSFLPFPLLLAYPPTYEYYLPMIGTH
ncbi:hypothetical protein L873DRAFT_1812700 [Choiromyces venosus 120613-1]|uniref:Uncharacterized protein n=1 Tax=Choiromyces venosus 120613-1 TaxID=1336337 RepID=A0A3N4JBC0_9PEZI|nr:hypothetical protein L873DRAFT_1812700 [Choiromyces venosus 120613-1]